MVIDVVVVVLVLAFAAWSWWRGLLRKLAGIAALVIASVAAGLVGREIARLAAARWNIQVGPAVYILCSVLAWVALFIVLRLAIGYLAKRWGSDEEGKPASWNRWLGALLGGVQALALCWFVLAILDAVPEDIRATRLGALHRQMEDSWVAWGTHATSPAALLELQPLIDDVSAVAVSPSVLRNLQYEEAVQKLQAHDKIQEILADRKLVDEFRAGRLRRFFSDRRVRDALEDPEIRDLLRQTPLRDTLRRLAGQAREREGDDE